MRNAIILIGMLLTAGAVQADVDADDNDDVVLRSEQGSLPAAGIEQLYLESGVGEVVLTAADTDAITWQLDIILGDNHDTPSQNQRDLAASAQLSAVREDEQARLTVAWPRGTKLGDDIHERWTISVPARLAAQVDMEIGGLYIEGLAGGVEADLGIGELEITVPGGSVHANMGIGEVKIISASKDLGEVSLDVDIGEVRFDGDADAPQPGYDFPIGQDLHFDAGGEDDIQINSNIGEISVEITAIKQ